MFPEGLTVISNAAAISDTTVRISKLKSFGFYVDKNFTIDLNQNYDNLNIILQNKYILNFKECLRKR